LKPWRSGAPTIYKDEGELRCLKCSVTTCELFCWNAALALKYAEIAFASVDFNGALAIILEISISSTVMEKDNIVHVNSSVILACGWS